MRVELNLKKEQDTVCKCKNCYVKKSIRDLKNCFMATLFVLAIAFDFSTTLFIILMAIAVFYDLL